MKTKIGKTAASMVLAMILCILFSMPVFAVMPTDRIHNYDIVVDINEDATCNMYYHINWEVLESDKAGELTWVKIGIPNSHAENIMALSDNIRRIDYSGSGGSYIEVYFKDSYKKGDVVDFSFSFTQDYIYKMNNPAEGYTTYSFTPGWFSDIETDSLVVMWNNDKADSWSPECEIVNGYNVWSTSLGRGQKFPISVTYRSEAFNFDPNKVYKSNASGGGTTDDSGSFLVGALCSMVCPCLIIFLIALLITKTYKNGANFGTGTTQKITRKKITYYPVCQGCGAAREDGQKFCAYCGRSFVQNEEIVTEENVPETEKDILNYKSEGEFKYGTNPNTFVRVHVINIPAARPAHTCVHSSCAHSSCACACACACAGGGRAGCTYKDFYRTGLKLKNIRNKKKN